MISQASLIADACLLSPLSDEVLSEFWEKVRDVQKVSLAAAAAISR